MNAKNRADYVAAWTSHLNELKGLYWNLSPEQQEELRAAMAPIHALIEKAGDDLEASRTKAASNGA